MPINKNELTKEMLAKAMQCKTADEYFVELSDVELDSEKLKNIAGGIDICYMQCPLVEEV